MRLERLYLPTGPEMNGTVSALLRARLHGPDRVYVWPFRRMSPEEGALRGSRVEVILVASDGTTLGVDLAHAEHAYDEDPCNWCAWALVENDERRDVPAYTPLNPYIMTEALDPTFEFTS